MSFGSTGVSAISNWIYLKFILTHPCSFVSWKLQPLDLKVENGHLSFSLSACVSFFTGRQDCCKTHEGQGIEQQEFKSLIFHLAARWQPLLSNSGWWLLHTLSAIATVIGNWNILKQDYQRDLWLLHALQRSIFSNGKKFEILWLFIIEIALTCSG